MKADEGSLGGKAQFGRRHVRLRVQYVSVAMVGMVFALSMMSVVWVWRGNAQLERALEDAENALMMAEELPESTLELGSLPGNVISAKHIIFQQPADQVPREVIEGIRANVSSLFQAGATSSLPANATAGGEQGRSTGAGSPFWAPGQLPSESDAVDVSSYVLARDDGLKVRSLSGATTVLLHLPGLARGERTFGCALGYTAWYVDTLAVSRGELSFKAAKNKIQGSKCRLLSFERKHWRTEWAPIAGTASNIKDEAMGVTMKWALPVNGKDKYGDHDLTVELLVFKHAFSIRSIIPDRSDFKSRETYSQHLLRFDHLGGRSVVYADLGNERGYATKNISTAYNYDAKWLKSQQVLPLMVRTEHEWSHGPAGPSLAMTVTEACTHHSRNAILSQVQRGVPFSEGIRVTYSRKSKKKKPPEVDGGGDIDFPWTVFMLGRNATELIRNQMHLGSLCEAPQARYEYSSWVKPGRVLRDVTVSTKSIAALSTYASRIGASYILVDAGWYGKESDAAANPRYPPKSPKGKPLDIAEAVRVAQKSGVGLFLYVNDLGLRVKNAYKIIDKFEKWGVKGLKMGFVGVSSVDDMERILRYVRYCAAKKIMVNIHDDFRDYGLHRTYPNIVSAEGIRGDEHEVTNLEHFLILPFVRMLGDSRADHTFSLDYDRLERQGRGLMFQMALPFIYHNGLVHIMWYLTADIMESRGLAGVLGLWRSVRPSWNRTVYLFARVAESICVAREASTGQWFVAAISAVNVSIPVSFNFLPENEMYRVEVFHRENVRPGESPSSPPHTRLVACRLDAGEDLNLPVRAHDGLVMVLTRKTTTHDLAHRCEDLMNSWHPGIGITVKTKSKSTGKVPPPVSGTQGGTIGTTASADGPKVAAPDAGVGTVPGTSPTSQGPAAVTGASSDITLPNLVAVAGSQTGVTTQNTGVSTSSTTGGAVQDVVATADHQTNATTENVGVATGAGTDTSAPATDTAADQQTNATSQNLGVAAGAGTDTSAPAFSAAADHQTNAITQNVGAATGASRDIALPNLVVVAGSQTSATTQNTGFATSSGGGDGGSLVTAVDQTHATTQKLGSPGADAVGHPTNATTQNLGVATGAGTATTALASGATAAGHPTNATTQNLRVTTGLGTGAAVPASSTSAGHETNVATQNLRVSTGVGTGAAVPASGTSAGHRTNVATKNLRVSTGVGTGAAVPASGTTAGHRTNMATQNLGSLGAAAGHQTTASTQNLGSTGITTGHLTSATTQNLASLGTAAGHQTTASTQNLGATGITTGHLTSATTQNLASLGTAAGHQTTASTQNLGSTGITTGHLTSATTQNLAAPGNTAGHRTQATTRNLGTTDSASRAAAPPNLVGVAGSGTSATAQNTGVAGQNLGAAASPRTATTARKPTLNSDVAHLQRTTPKFGVATSTRTNATTLNPGVATTPRTNLTAGVATATRTAATLHRVGVATSTRTNATTLNTGVATTPRTNLTTQGLGAATRTRTATTTSSRGTTTGAPRNTTATALLLPAVP